MFPEVRGKAIQSRTHWLKVPTEVLKRRAMACLQSNCSDTPATERGLPDALSTHFTSSVTPPVQLLFGYVLCQINRLLRSLERKTLTHHLKRDDGSFRLEKTLLFAK